jgi:alpha 1,3-glucosidase
MKNDPFTLRVALSKAGSARGDLYLDDGETYSHQQGQFVWREFVVEKPAKKAKTIRLSSKDLGSEKPDQAVDGVTLKTFNPANEFAKSIGDIRVEKITVLGLNAKPTAVRIEAGQDLVWDYVPGVASSDKKEGASSVLTIKDPKVLIVKDWAIVIQW